MNKNHWINLMLLLLFSLVMGCGETAVPTPPPMITTTPIPAAAPAPGNDRILNISVTEAAGEEFDTAMTLAKSIGAQAVSLSVYWDEIETAPGVYNPDPNWLKIANLYYPAQAIQVSLTLSVIDTNNVRLPHDLANKSFDDPAVIERFNALLDYVAAQIPDLTLSSLAIGNEIDIYLEDDAEQWSAYERFFAETAVHARTHWPQVPIGSKVTFDGITGHQTTAIQSLNQYSDVVLITYYPLDPDFNVRPATAVHDDFQTLADTFPNQTIHLLETGYPSGAGNNSSYDQQAEFIHELFLAWDTHADQMPVLNYTWLTDMPSEAVTQMTDYYRLDAAGFVSYLATLGLRTVDGVEKPAFHQLAAESKARGLP